MEKATWTFVSFDLAPGQAFYMTAQWWKDVNGNEKYMIGYQMELEIGNFNLVTADYVSSLIAEMSTVADEAKKA